MQRLSCELSLKIIDFRFKTHKDRLCLRIKHSTGSDLLIAICGIQNRAPKTGLMWLFTTTDGNVGLFFQPKGLLAEHVIFSEAQNKQGRLTSVI